MVSLFISLPLVARVEGRLHAQVCQLHSPAVCSWSNSVQQTIKHWGNSLIHHEKQNFSSMQLQFTLTEVKSFLIKP